MQKFYQAYYENQINKDISIPAIECQAMVLDADLIYQQFFLEDVALQGDPAVWIDKGAKAGVCGPDQWPSVFNRPENGHYQMLVRGTAHPIPGVVSDVYQDGGPFFNAD